MQRTGATYVYELIKTSLELLFEKRMGYYAARPLLIYLLQKVEGGFLPLNRDYKPLGLMEGPWAEYNEFKFLIIPPSEVNLNEELKQETFLFGDATTPRNMVLKIRYKNLLMKTLPYLKKTEPL